MEAKEVQPSSHVADRNVGRGGGGNQSTSKPHMKETKKEVFHICMESPYCHICAQSLPESPVSLERCSISVSV